MPPCHACSRDLSPFGRFCPSCGAEVPTADTDLTGPYRPVNHEPPAGPRFAPGRILASRYRIITRLGMGGMGEVYRADDLRLNQPVALKFLPAEWANDSRRLSALYDEVRLARQISHANVCRVYDIAEADGQPFLSMEYLDGEDLASLLRRIGRLPPDKGTDIARQMCLGLAAAHEQGVIHRDLKPANVMLDGRGRVRIMDFGLARASAQVTGPDAHSGTPAYMAPEQLSGKEATARSDLYALGLVLYECFTGKKAFAAASRAELMELQERSSPPSPSSHVTDLDPAVERVIMRCLERDPSRRPLSALAVAAALPGGDPLTAALAVGETPSPEMVANAGESGILAPRVAVALMLAVVVGLVGFLLLYPRVMLVGRIDLREPTDALARKARDVLQVAGHAQVLDDAVGFDHDQDFLRWVEKNDPSPTRWDRLNRRPSAAVYFWYRLSPRHLVPHLFYPYAGSIEVSRISWDDPPQNVPGMAAVKLDVRGRLLEFLRVPKGEDADEPQRPAWAKWFDLAELEFPRFEKAESPTHIPEVFADERFAWTGTTSADERIRVEAGTFRGRVVYFVLVTEWAERAYGDGVQGIGNQGSAVSQFHLFVLVLVAMFALGPYSVRSGRAGPTGAARSASACASSRSR